MPIAASPIVAGDPIDAARPNLTNDAHALAPFRETQADEVNRRLNELYALAALSDEGANHLNDLIEDRNAKLAEVANYEIISERDHKRPPNPDELARLQQRADRATFVLRRAQEDMKRRPATARATYKACSDFIAQIRRRNQEIGDGEPVKVSKGDTIDGLRQKITDLRNDRDRIETALPRLEVVLAEVEDRVHSAAHRATPTAMLRIERRESGRIVGTSVEVQWPETRIDTAAPRRGGDVPRVIDAYAIACAQNSAFMIEREQEAIRRAYDQTDAPQLDDSERYEQLAQIDAAILDAERKECALIWEEIDAGRAASFRADANPVAVLNVAA